MTATPAKPNGADLRTLSALAPFLKPYGGALGLALLFLVLAAGSTLMFPVALRDLIDQGLSKGATGTSAMSLRAHFFSLFSVAIALGVFSAGRYYVVTWIGERVTADIRNAVYSHVLEQSPIFFETTQTGEVLSRLSADTTLIQTVVGSSFSMGLRNAVMGVGALCMLIYHNPYVMMQVLAILSLVVLPALWIGRRVRRLSRASQDRLADSSAIAAEILNAISVVQSHSAQRREAARFASSTEASFQAAVRRSRTRALLVAFLIISTSAALLWGLFQGTQAVIQGRMSAGDLGQTVVYVIILASAFAVLGEVYGDIQRAAGAAERLVELLAARSAIQDPEGPVLPPDLTPGSSISFDAVEFSYPSRPHEPALHRLQLSVAPGETVALVGASGAGKSTVFQLLQRFYDPANGDIRLDGVPLRSWRLSDLRQRMAVVPQDAVIFSATAMENIRYGRPDATDAEVEAAARAAFADEFIRRLPDGYRSFLGERGVRLSGGQRQRLAIARAILKDAPVLLLDEATSALDAESEYMVQAALEQAMRAGAGRRRTTLIIAHRLSTVQRADRIVVLEQGRVIEEGSHESLIRRAGAYARLAALQFSPAA